MKTYVRLGFSSLALAVFFLAGLVAARGAARTWGGSASGLWTTAANWDINTVPVNGDLLLFPPGPAQLLTTNSVGGATNFHSLTLSGSNYVLVAPAPLSLTNGLTNVVAATFVTNTIRAHLVPRASQTWVTSAKTVLVLASNVNFTNLTLTVDSDGVAQFDGAINGGASSTLTKTNSGTMSFSGAATLTQLNVNQGTLRVGGTLVGGLSVAAGAKAEGTGTIPPFTCAGTLAPGEAAPGTLTVASGGGAATFSAGSVFSVQLNGTMPDTGHGQLKVASPPTLTGATLLPSVGFSPLLGDTFVIITNTGAVAFTTTFSGRPEGSTQTVGNVQFRVSYVGGNGNDVTLTVAGFTASATTRTWTGAATATDANWLNATNWSGNVAPGIGDALLFPAGPTSLSMVNNFATNSTFDRLTFGAGGYDLLGNAFRLLGGISATQASGLSTLHAPVTFNGPLTARVDQASALLDLLAPVTLNGLFTADGAGIVRVQAAVGGSGGMEVRNQTYIFSSNSYAGVTRVLSGAYLYMPNASALGAATPSDDTLVESNATLEVGFNRAVAEPLRLAGSLTLDSQSSWTGAITLSGGGAVFFTFTNGTGTITGPLNFTDAGPVRVTGQGGTVFQGPCAGAVRPLFVADAGLFRVNTVLSAPVQINAGILDGTGEVGNITIQSPFLAALLRPGVGGGVLTCSNLSYVGSAKLFEADLVAPGVFGQLRARGTVQLGGPLAVSAAFVPALGSVFTIIDNQGAFPVSGTFTGFPEGALLTTDGATYRISYLGGDGNDVTLTLLSVTPTGVTRLWTGAGANNYWSNPTNWAGTNVPVAGDALLFPARVSSPHFQTTNDFPANTIFDQLIFRDGTAGGGTVLHGNAIVLQNGLLATNTADTLAVSLPLVLNGSQTFAPPVPAITFGNTITLNGDLMFGGGANAFVTLNGAVTGAGGIIKTNPGGLTLNVSNSFTGPVQLQAGSLAVGQASALGAPGGGIFTGAGTTLTLAHTGALAENFLSIAGAISVTATNVIPGQIALPQNNTSFNVGGTGQLTLAGAMTGEGGPKFQGGGTIVLTGTNDTTGGTTVQNSTLLVHGRSVAGDISVSPAPSVLGGTGVVGRVDVQNNGTLSPGASPGLLTSGDVSLFASAFLVELNGPAPGAGYDQLNVNGTVLISGASLQVALGFMPPMGSVFTLINNDGADAVSGTFNGLPEGSTFTTNGFNFRVSYLGGDGNDMTLTRVFVPTGTTRSWSGTGANALWSNRTNWSGSIAPVEGDNLVFPSGAARKINTNDFPAFTAFNLITYDPLNVGYTNTGAPFAVAAGLFANSGGGVCAISNSIRLLAPQNFNAGAVNAILDLRGPVDLQTNTLTFGGVALANTRLSGVVSGSGGIIQNGAFNNTVTLAATNTYSGVTRVQGGTLVITTDGALGDTNGNTVISAGAALEISGTNGANLTIAEPIFFDAVSPQTATLVNSSRTNTLAGPILIGPGDDAGQFAVTGGELVVNGLLSGGGVLKSGSNRAIFNANNTHTNRTRVARGTLLVNGSQPNSTVSVDDFPGAVLGGQGTVGRLVPDGGLISPGASPGILTFAGHFECAATQTNLFELNSNGAGTGHDQITVLGDIFLNSTVLRLSFGYTPAFGDSLTLLKNNGLNPVTGTFAGLPEGTLLTNGPAVLRLSYTGGDGNDVTLARIAVPTGVTRVWDGGGANNLWSNPTNWAGDVLPQPGDDVVFPGGTPRLFPIFDAGTNVPFNTITLGDAYNLSPAAGHTLHLLAGLTATNTGTTARVLVPLTLDSNQTWTVTQSNRTLQAGQLDLGFYTLTHAGPGNLELAGSVTGQGGLVGNSPGSISIKGTNIFTGPVIINAGTLQVSSADALGSPLAGTFIGTSSTLDLETTAGQTVNEPLTLAGTFASLTAARTNTWAGPITVAGGQAKFTLNGGQLNLDGSLAGAGLQIINGTVAMNAANPFTGPVRVTGLSALLANGALPALTVVLTNGGTLGGTGVVGQVSGRFCTTCGVAPGSVSVPGVLTTGDLDLQDAQYHLDLAGAAPGGGYDQITAQGKVRLTGARLALNTSFTPAPGQVFTIIDNDGTDPVTGNFIGLPQNKLLTNNGVIFQISYTGGDGNDVTLTHTLAAPASTIRFSGVDSNGLFSITGQGVPNTPYVIEATPHLLPPIPWQPVATNNSDGAGVYQFTDLVSTNFPMRFYRVLSP